MKRRTCPRCGNTEYWSYLDDEPAPCCFAPDPPPIEHEEPDFDHETEQELDRHIRRTALRFFGRH